MTMLVTFLLALALDALFGDPPNRFHPVLAMGSFIRWASRQAPARGPLRQYVYGVFLMLAGLGLFTLLLFFLSSLIRPYPWLSIVVNVLLLKSAFSMRRLLEAGREVEKALEAGDLAAARRKVSWHLVSRDKQTLSAGHVASATVESLAENLTDSFVAPLLAFAIGGVPLAWAYRFINTADAMIGYHTEQYEYLGKFAARLDDVLNWIPARLTGLLIVLAAPFVDGSWRSAWHVLITQHGRTASPNAGWPMSAAAGALAVTLEKIGYYRLEGNGTMPKVMDMRRARKLVIVAAILWGIVCVALLIPGIQ